MDPTEQEALQQTEVTPPTYGFETVALHGGQ